MLPTLLSTRHHPTRTSGVVQVLACLLILLGGIPAGAETGPASAPPPPAPASDTPPANRSPSSSYEFVPGDLVVFTVFGHADLTTTVRIPPSGQATFPLIGTVDHLLGRNPDAVCTDLQHRYEDGYLRHAPVTATLSEFGPRLVTIMGSVGHQDAIKLSPFTPTTALQAIGEVGGFLPDANRNAALVIRDDPDHPGMKQVIPIPSEDKPDAMSKDVVLKPGDLITVPRLDRIFIIGRVGTVGAISLPSDEKLTVSKAISLAGGFAQYAKQDQVQLIRNGHTVHIVDVRGLLSGGNRGVDPVLQPGDTIFVPESRF